MRYSAEDVIQQVDVVVPEDVLDLLDEMGEPVSSVLTEFAGDVVLDDEAVAQLRRRAVVGFYDQLPSAYSELDDDPVPADEHVVLPGFDGTLQSVDFASVVAGLDWVDTNGALAELLSYRDAYIAAAREAGKGNPSAEFYNAVNGPLFRERIAAVADVTQLEEVPVDDRDALQRVRVRRGRARVEQITALIVRFNYGMTRGYVRRFTSNTAEDDSQDFQGAAVLGLMASIDTFDPALGKFGSWAYKRIQREVLRAVRNADFKSMNLGDFERRPIILRAYQKLAGPDGAYRPSFEEVAAESGETVAMVSRVLAAPRLDSLHAPVGPEQNTELGELVADTGIDVEEEVLLSMDVDALTEYGLPNLDARERYVLSRRYGLDGEPVQCLSGIGKQLGLSREAVRQIETKAVARLMHPATLARIVRQGRDV